MRTNFFRKSLLGRLPFADGRGCCSGAGAGGWLLLGIAATATARRRAGCASRGPVLTVNATPHFGRHGQLLYGGSPYYLSHLAVFMGRPDDHPHNFQVEQPSTTHPRRPPILTAARPVRRYLHGGAGVLRPDGARDGRAGPPASALAPGHDDRTRAFREGGQVIIPSTELNLERIVYFREFVADGEKLERPEYLLFGRSDEVFLTHLISAPPDFQQVLKVEFTGEGNTQDILPGQLDSLLAEGLVLALADRENTVAERVRPEELLVCSVDTDTRLPLATASLRIVEEIYCEEGELSELVMASFNDPRRCEQ